MSTLHFTDLAAHTSMNASSLLMRFASSCVRQDPMVRLFISIFQN